MSDTSQGAGWWQASDGKWYVPQSPLDVGSTLAEPPVVVPPQPDTTIDQEPFPDGLPSAWVAAEPSPVPQSLPIPTQPVDTGLLPLGAVAAGFHVGASYPANTDMEVQAQSPTKKRRIPPWVSWTLAAIFFVTTVAISFVALHENSVAEAWHKDYQKAQVQLAAAHASIASLTGQVSSLNTQLAAQSTAKEKALDQNGVLNKLVSQESSVSTELNTCVTDLQTLITTIGNDLSSGYYSDPSVGYEANTARSDCNQAQSANQSLQTALNGAAG